MEFGTSGLRFQSLRHGGFRGFEVSAWDLGSFGRSLAGRTKGSFSRSASCLVFTKRVVYSFVSSWLSVRCAGLFKRFASVDRTFSRN